VDAPQGVIIQVTGTADEGITRKGDHDESETVADWDRLL